MPTQHILVSFYRVKQKPLMECFLWYPLVFASNKIWYQFSLL
ncbi:hypothetical protein OUG_0375 [Helicobacter pylori R32b]|nr:hypothetical protein OUG_0375 [Helicobacter pylori R32b]